ncbi:MAG: Gfo/Idh/MocA family oxidoreductase [Melioribacteraceae bacterium]|nr:Gfo/Idh/MocA family oxidoreductase [Melioribacteraceae bacterium]
MKNIKTGIIGSGFMGAAHTEALRRIGGVEITAVASDDEIARNLIADKYGISQRYSDWQEIINDPEIEVVHNCTPNYLHYEINKAAIESGKHIISEKPLTISVAQSEVLIKLLETSGVVNAVNFNYRFYPLIQHLKKTVDENELGSIYYIHGHYLQDWLYYDTDYNWRLEPELSGESRAVADIGSHWCDLIQFVTGKKITEVFANLITVHKTRKKPPGSIETFKGKEAETVDNNASEIEVKTEDAGSVMFRLENGTYGVFTVSQVSAGRKNNFMVNIDGSKKSISWNQENPNEMWIGYREKANEVLLKDPSLLKESAREYAHYPGGHPEGYPDGPKNMFHKIYGFIRSGLDPRKVKPEFPTFKDGHIENKIVESILKSSKDKTWIKV